MWKRDCPSNFKWRRMCGIAGIISVAQQGVSEHKVQKAIASLHHRGPEYSKYWNSNGVAFGHCRLSIIDLSSRAQQPFHYAGYTIVYNGEIYNYIEIREALIKKGYTFTTASDTEVVIAAYAAYGSQCLQRFDGAFAFAIWDEKEQTLFAARDRFGEKPFFFSVEEEQFFFASEIKALWQMGLKKEVNSAMLYNFLTIGYVTNPADGKETFFSNILKLPAASFLTFKQGKPVEIESYWRLNINVSHRLTEQTAMDTFTHLFAQSVSRRLRSDVAIGTSLSGGLDSSAVVAFCQQQSNRQYTHKSFTAIFPGFEKNEQQYAAFVAKKFNLHPHYITIEEDEVVDLMNRLSFFQEEPVGAASALAQYKVFEAAKAAGVTVLLDGQGADEILAGYSKYYKWYWRELYAQKQLALSGEMAAAKALGVPASFGWLNKTASLFPHFAASLQQQKKERAAYRHPALNREFAFAHKRHSYYSLPVEFGLNQALHYNTTTNGLEELLRMADRNSMAHSVEVRLPFLSHELVEFLFTLPPHFKIHKGWSKWLLRKAAEPLLPEEIVWRKDKTGFEPPQKKWMENKQVQEAIGAAKEKLVDQNILHRSMLQKKIQPHHSYAGESLDWRIWSASYLL